MSVTLANAPSPRARLSIFYSLLIGFVAAVSSRQALALPSFARQTGQPCSACHTDFPGLTPFGRRFKLGGYTLGGGDYRSELFPGDPSEKKKPYIPPAAFMAILGYTHTKSDLPAPTTPYAGNDNFVFSPFSIFYGGAITDHIGAFAQITHNAVPPGGFSDPFGHTWTWDNTDIRYANTGQLGKTPFTYGVTANNNPSVQDVWNTTPAWIFPYDASTLAPTPATHTIVDGAFAAHVGGVGAYAFINDTYYLEATAYRTLGFNAQNDLGVDPLSSPGLYDGVAPYWRLAAEPHWGSNWLEIGTFGMYAAIRPWTGSLASTFEGASKFTDLGVDSQYQYQGKNYWLTLRGSLIHEDQDRSANFLDGISTNSVDRLNTLRLQSSLSYGNNQKIVFTGQYFNTWGTSDALLYSGLSSGDSPNSNGWIAEIAYIPFNQGISSFLKWSNARLSLQYTHYNEFDGTSIDASNNDTLFLSAWVAE